MAKFNLKRNKQQQQYAVVGALLLAGGGFSYFRYFWMPTSARIRETTEKIKAVEEKINKAKGQAGRLPTIQKELERLNEQAIEAEKQLPKNKNLPAVIVTVGSLARKNSVEVRSFLPGGASQKEYYIEVPYTLSMQGTYHNIARFFASVALEERIFNVRNVIYGAPNTEGKMTVTYTLISYQSKG